MNHVRKRFHEMTQTTQSDLEIRHRHPLLSDCWVFIKYQVPASVL